MHARGVTNYMAIVEFCMTLVFTHLNRVRALDHHHVSPDAMDACMAMKPEERPMSFTRPMPRAADRASVLAAISAV